MYQTFGEFLLRLSAHSELWAVFVIGMMAVTAVLLYLFWDVVGRGVSLGARLWNGRRYGQPGNGQSDNSQSGNGQSGNSQSGNGQSGNGQSDNSQSGNGRRGNGQPDNGQSGNGRRG